MYLPSEKKQEIFKKFGGDAKNTGSTEGQVALFTFRINHLTGHLKTNKQNMREKMHCWPFSRLKWIWEPVIPFSS